MLKKVSFSLHVFMKNEFRIFINFLVYWFEKTNTNVCYEKFVAHLLLYTVANVSRIFRNRRLAKGNYSILRIGLMGSLSSLQKPEFLKLIISCFHYFRCQKWDQWQIMIGKKTHIYFFYFWLKNKQVWAEQIGKKTEKIP